jgi:hypothetical protein
MHDLAVRLENRVSEAAELRTRLELTEKIQSTIERSVTGLPRASDRLRNKRKCCGKSLRLSGVRGVGRGCSGINSEVGC